MSKKIKFVMSLLLVALASGQTWATKIAEIPFSTPTQLDAVPLDCDYGDYGYHSQMVYPQNLLQAAALPEGAIITAITFYTWHDYKLINPEGTENNPLTIKLGQPENHNLSRFVTDNLTTVSTSGNIWSGTNAVTLEFDVDKAYRYDGGNLLIDLSWGNKPNGYHKSSIYWEGSAASTAASRTATCSSSGEEGESTPVDYLP